MRELTEGECIPNVSNYEITEDQFVEIINLMLDERYLNPKRVRINILGTAEIDKSIDTVTVKGYDYIDDNCTLAKLYKGLKDIKDFIKIQRWARTIRVEVKLNPKEYKKLKSDCKKSGFTKFTYLRKLICKQVIKEKPDEEFFFLLTELYNIGREMEDVFYKADYLNLIDKNYYKKEAEKLNSLMDLIKKEYL